MITVAPIGYFSDEDAHNKEISSTGALNPAVAVLGVSSHCCCWVGYMDVLLAQGGASKHFSLGFSLQGSRFPK